MAHLEFYKDDVLLFVHLLRPGRTVIGRSDRSDVVLPSEQISRTHCFLEQRTEGWWLTDKSSHGTKVNGTQSQRHHLRHLDVLSVGPYVIRFILNIQAMSTESQALIRHQMSETTANITKPAAFEEIVDMSSHSVASQRGQLTFSKGPQAGSVHILKHSRMSIGGPGSDIEIDATLPPHAVRIRVVRGRVMVEPGNYPATLAGHRVREITPARKGESVCIGAHRFVIDVHINDEHLDSPRFGRMLGQSPCMRQVFGLLNRLSAHNGSVLLTGESGTGKELAAHGVHLSSPRADGNFVPINCAGIPENLFESELFGHEKGAFTGATKQQDGAFHQADKGTLFLDEIGELPLTAQAKLLRVLDSGEVRRVGAHKASCPDVRVIAATNRNLPEMVQKGTFRGDLYFRLAVLTVRLPPLRDRTEDVPLLATALLKALDENATISKAGLSSLATYHWPGNVRELRNVLTRAYVMAGPELSTEHFSFNPGTFEVSQRARLLSKDAYAQQEKEAIIIALQEHQGNKSKAARALGMPRSSLLYKLKRLNIHS